MNLEKLNAQCAIEELQFVEGPGGLIMAKIDNGLAKARISTYAGQVLSFQPHGEEEDLLFVSEFAYYQPGKAIKGGMPICWPWFGPDPEDKGRPAHGLVRAAQWEVLETQQMENGSTRLRLGITENDETLTSWPHNFALAVEVTVGRQLDVSLITINTEENDLTLTQALHTYFKVGDIGEIAVEGLDGCAYIDKMDDSKEKKQQGTVTISEQTERIYTGVTGDLVINDPSLSRRIRIRSQGSNSTVVWNPWIGQSAEMGDLGDEEYKQMICVETTNAGPDQVTVPGNGEYRLSLSYSIERN
ncbi:MAG: D-hexose-6-phosphate mutarotase [Halieaceae bacterium]|nr:D-hexose-6-phosphate mutarotase [Halieaceae bacterium]